MKLSETIARQRRELAKLSAELAENEQVYKDLGLSESLIDAAMWELDHDVLAKAVATARENLNGWQTAWEEAMSAAAAAVSEYDRQGYIDVATNCAFDCELATAAWRTAVEALAAHKRPQA